MKYYIDKLEEFSVIGQEIELSNFQKINIQISTRFWTQFNVNLKKAYLSQYGNWVKYAFTERRARKLFYYCAIPTKTVTPKHFMLKEVKAHRYLVVEHTGSMDNIYATYRKFYQEILPNNNYRPIQSDFLHFEKYDYRFNWNRDNSIINIYIPIEG
ncbi:MAG: GyrI-like domain-containing protein [Clostridium sp.]|uniref:GyrI-like domain-containing protein n=1 Tax=Clostridium sp. TaxID=1506 RepID=UPI003F2BB87B